MKTFVLGLLTASALAGAAAPAFADPTDKVIVQQYRDKIVAARQEPGVDQYGGAELDRALATLPELDRALDQEKPKQVEATSSRIDALIATARTRAQTELAKQQAADAAIAARDATAAAEAEAAQSASEAARASSEAAAARAESEQLKQQLAEYRMRQTALGATLVLQDVLFETGRAELKPGAAARLQPLAQYLQANPEVRVRIDGHTDSQGGDAYNQRLSDARASAVRTALASLGVDGRRVEALGHGESQPVADNRNEAGRQQNRRVEVTLLGQQANALALR